MAKYDDWCENCMAHTGHFDNGVCYSCSKPKPKIHSVVINGPPTSNVGNREKDPTRHMEK
jgi:hypothetical protein